MTGFPLILACLPSIYVASKVLKRNTTTGYIHAPRMQAQEKLPHQTRAR